MRFCILAALTLALAGALLVGTDRGAVRSAPFAFAVTDPSPVPRRAIIDAAKCEACHLSLVQHSNVRGAAGTPKAQVIALRQRA